MKKLKIGLFNDSFPPDEDGVARVVESYAKVMHENNIDVTVVKPKHKNIVYKYPFEVYQYPSISMGKRIGYNAGLWVDAKTLYDMLNKKFDIIHAHAPFTSFMLARMISMMEKTPIVLTYHTRYDIDIEKRLPVKTMQKTLKKFVSSNVHRADEVWAVTQGCGGALKDIGYNKDYVVMENGTDFEQRRSSENVLAELREKHKISDDEFVFVYAGRMMWYKNIRIIVDTLKILKNNGLKFKAFFLGDGYDMKEIQAHVFSQGLLSNVTFLGYVRDREILRSYLSAADMFLFPSTYDTSGLVVKESAACDCPCLLVKGSCAAEGVVHGHSGYLAEENAVSCAHVVWEACNNRKEIKRVGKNAANEIYLSWDNAVDKAYDRYEQILYNWDFKKTRRR